MLKITNKTPFLYTLFSKKNKNKNPKKKTNKHCIFVIKTKKHRKIKIDFL